VIGVAEMAKTDFTRLICLKRNDPVAGKPVVALAAAIAVGLLSGCAHRDSITVGSIPDDYRTNHPIMIAEQNEVLDLPVAAGDRGMTQSQRTALAGFLDTYDHSALPVVTITVPNGSSNDAAAADAAHDFRHFIRSSGVPDSRIMMASYQAPSIDVSAPVRVSYVGMRAQTNKCGRWPDDMLKDADNKHYADFGCSYQNNLAAQVANPADLLGPRKRTEVDAEERSNVIDKYRTRALGPEFIENSEINF
jgi:pilus assembly protein CpaD